MSGDGGLRIRPLEKGDVFAVGRICFETSIFLSRPYLERLVLLKWALPYAEAFPEHCFVAEEGNAGAVGGYILAVSDTRRFRRVMKRDWEPRIRAELEAVLPRCSPEEQRELRGLFGTGEKPVPLWQRRMEKQYPAHLHIDLLPPFQRQGLGHRMTDHLVRSLSEAAVPGLHLWVGASNLKGVSFYRKYGFREAGERGRGTMKSLCFTLSLPGASAGEGAPPK